MANYSNLINSIKAVIKQNGTNDITGQLMQDVLVAMTNSIGRFATFAGVASPTTNPGTIDQNVFYLASIAGTYPNFGGIVVPPDRLVALHNISGSWEMVVIVTFSDGGTISIDPALDPNSVNPVENRAVTGAINDLDTRVSTLEQSGAMLYYKTVTLYAASANIAMVCTILVIDKNSDAIDDLDELAPYIYPILQAGYIGESTNKALTIQFIQGGAAVVTQSLMTAPYTTKWNIPAGGVSWVSCSVLPSSRQ